MQKPLQVLHLERYKDENRLLLVFAPSAQDERYLEQKRLFRSLQEQLSERDLLVFYLFEQESGYVGEQEITYKAAQTVREAFSVSPASFTAVLVGKDGTEKERAQKPMEPIDLFVTIDQMPMRRRETRG